MSGAMRGALVRAPINSNDRPNAGHREWKKRDVTNETWMLNHEMQYRKQEAWKMAQHEDAERIVCMLCTSSRAHCCAEVATGAGATDSDADG